MKSVNGCSFTGKRFPKIRSDEDEVINEQFRDRKLQMDLHVYPGAKDLNWNDEMK